jgi:hypothetical protein
MCKKVRDRFSIRPDIERIGTTYLRLQVAILGSLWGSESQNQKPPFSTYRPAELKLKAALSGLSSLYGKLLIRPSIRLPLEKRTLTLLKLLTLYKVDSGMFRS